MKSSTTNSIPGKAEALVFSHSHWLWMGPQGNKFALVLSCPYTLRCGVLATSLAHPRWIVGTRLRESTNTAITTGLEGGCRQLGLRSVLSGWRRKQQTKC